MTRRTLSAPMRLLFWLLLAVLLPLAVFAALVLDRSQRAWEMNVQRNLDTVAERKAARVERWVDERLGDVGMLAVRPGLASCLQGFSQIMRAQRLRTDAYMTHESRCLPVLHHDAFADFSNALLIDADGRVVFTTLRESDFGASIDAPPLQNTRMAATVRHVMREQRSRFSPFEYYGPARAETAFFVAPVSDGTRIVGVLALQVDVPRVVGVAVDGGGSGRINDTLVGRRAPDGSLQQLAATRDATLKPHAETPLAGLQRSMQLALDGSGGAGRDVDGSSAPMIAAWRPLPSLGWGLVVHQALSEALAPVRELREVMLQIGLLALLGATGAAVLYWRRVVRPIGLLAEVSKRIAQGDDSRRAPLFGEGTVRALGEAFNEMLDRLQAVRGELAQNNNELEKRIRARTEDLQRLVETLDASDRKFRRVIDASQIGLWHLNATSNELVLSGHPRTLHGHRAEDLVTLDGWLDLVHPDDRVTVQQALAEHLAGRSDAYDVTYRMLSSDGEWRWNHDNGKVVERDPQGMAQRALGVSQDVTASKQAEARLRLTQFFVDNASEWTLMIDREGRIREANETAIHRLGHTREQLLSLRIWMIDTTFGAEEWPQRWEARKNLRNTFFETLHQTREGERIPVEVNATFLSYQGEEFVCSSIRDISARREAEAALQEERELFTNGPVVIFKWRNEEGWPVDYVSRNVGDVLGYPADQFLDNQVSFQHLVTSEDLPRLNAELAQAIADGRRVVEHSPYRIVRADGEERWLFDYTMLLHDNHGVVTHFFGYVLDITEQQHGQIMLAREQALLRGLMDSVPDLIFYKNLEGVYIGCNRAFARFAGCSEDQIIGRTDYQIFDADTARHARDADREVMESGAPKRSEEWVAHTNGRKLLLDTLKIRFADEQGNPLGLIGVSRDLTERHTAQAEREQLERELHLTRAMRAEQAVASAQERTHVLLESITQGILEADNDGRITYVNSAGARILGYEKQDLVGRPFALAVRATQTTGNHPMAPPILPMRSGSHVVHDEQSLHRRDGSSFVAEYSCQPLQRGGENVGAVMVFWDVSERRIVDDRLRQMLRAVEQSPVAVVITDLDGRIEYVNPKFCESAGYSEREVIGQRPSILKTEHTSPAEFAQMWRAIASGQTWHGEFLNRRKDNSLFWESVSISPIKDHEGSITHYIGIKEDITERKAFEDQLRSAKETAEAATRTKSQFLASMSHEIRTPMNAILGMTHLALKTALDAKQRNYISKAHGAANSLLGVINDILDFSRIEAGKLAMEIAPFGLQDVLGNVGNVVGLRAQEKGLALAFDLAPDLPASLEGDSLRLGQILINLGTNAIKFTEHGQVRFSVSVVRFDVDSVTLEFTVSDTGIGISAEARQRLFQPFSQADTSTTRRYGGSGLGLVICRQLVELMDGEIGVDSEPGQGSTFWFTAKLGLTSSEALADATPSRRSLQPISSADLARIAARLSGARILLVEDYPLNQELALEFLRVVGLQVTLAAHGREALEILARERFDAVLMDCQMPVMDGYTAVVEIRQQECFRDLPVIAMTADAMAEDRERVLAAGMNDHIAKPIDPMVLYTTLERWLPGVVRTPVSPPDDAGGSRAKPVVSDPAFELLAGIDHQAGLVRAMGKVAFYRRLLGLFATSQRQFSASFRAARQQGSAIDAQRHVHTLKGSAAHIGAHDTHQAAIALEEALQRDAAPDVIEDLLAQTEAALSVVLAGIEAMQGEQVTSA